MSEHEDEGAGGGAGVVAGALVLLLMGAGAACWLLMARAPAPHPAAAPGVGGAAPIPPKAAAEDPGFTAGEAAAEANADGTYTVTVQVVPKAPRAWKSVAVNRCSLEGGDGPSQVWPASLETLPAVAEFQAPVTLRFKAGPVPAGVTKAWLHFSVRGEYSDAFASGTIDMGQACPVDLPPVPGEKAK